MTETFNVVFVEELTRMEITCPGTECGTVIGFDAADPKAAPSRCPSCGTEFGFEENSLREIVQRYRAFFHRIRELNLKARFRIAVPEKQ